MELDGIPGPRQIATSEDEGGFVPVRPPRSLSFKTKRGLIGSRSHDVAVDRLEERLDESRVHGVPAYEFVRGFEPVDAPVLSSDEAVEARRHVDRYVRIRVCHRFALTSSARPASRLWSRPTSHVVIHRKLVRVRTKSQHVVFFLFHVDPVCDEVFVEDVAAQQEGMIGLERFDGAAK